MSKESDEILERIKHRMKDGHDAREATRETAKELGMGERELDELEFISGRYKVPIWQGLKYVEDLRDSMGQHFDISLAPMELGVALAMLSTTGRSVADMEKLMGSGQEVVSTVGRMAIILDRYYEERKKSEAVETAPAPKKRKAKEAGNE
jgi:hypothetical protein